MSEKNKEEQQLMNKDGVIIVEDTKKKLTIRGKTKGYPVYQIPLNYLYYNDQNGRIATYMNEVQDEIDIKNLEEYNNVIHEFIVQSDPAALKATKDNIQKYTQKHAAVVLSDGRVIDGNRRFTCMRELTTELKKDHYLEAVILDETQGLTAKDIKTLELNLQQAEDKPVDYNPIDNLVDVYRDLIKNKMFTEEEYAGHRDQNIREVRKDKEVAELLVDFLEFIHAPGKFHIARKLKLDGPLREFPRILKKFDDEVENSLIKDSLFAALIAKTDGDSTRYIRDIGKHILSVGTRKEEFLDDYEDVIEDFYDEVEGRDTPVNTLEDLGEALEESGIVKKSDEIIDEHLEDARTEDIKSEPVDYLNKAFRQVDNVDLSIFAYMDTKTKKDFEASLKKLNDTMENINKGFYEKK